MVLHKRKYDLAWGTAVLLGAVSVLVADGGYEAAKPYLYTLLGVALLLSSFLAFFVVRKDDLSFEAPACENRASENEALAEHLSDAESNATDDHSVPIRWILEHEQSSQLVTEMATAKIEEQVALRRSIYFYLESQSPQMFTETLSHAYHAQQKTSQRRNILSEACDLAKTLRGSGSEVLVSPDNYILIRDSNELSKAETNAHARDFMPGKHSNFVN